MSRRDAFVFSQNGTVRRDTAAGPSNPFAAALKTLSAPKPKAATPKPASPTPPAPSA